VFDGVGLSARRCDAQDPRRHLRKLAPRVPTFVRGVAIWLLMA
jgi:hypothetical protein